LVEDYIPEEVHFETRFETESRRAIRKLGSRSTNSKGEKIMNMYTNARHPEGKAHRIPRIPNIAILTALLTLVATIAVAVYIAIRPAVVTEGSRAVPYSNALEMQYARPWLEAQNKPVVIYGNALELQYAQPWLDAQNKPVVTYGNALEMQYAQPWLDKAERPIVVTGNTQEQLPLNCFGSMEMLYACKNGYGLP
jgi:hypothetical protein